MNTKQRVSAPRGRASCRFGCQRVGCDRISLPRNPQGRKIATNNFGVREMSVKLCGPHRIPQSNRAARRAGLYGRRWLANTRLLECTERPPTAAFESPRRSAAAHPDRRRPPRPRARLRCALVGQPSQAASPSARIAELPKGLVFGVDRSINVKMTFQPPLSGAAWLARRRTTVPKSIS